MVSAFVHETSLELHTTQNHVTTIDSRWHLPIDFLSGKIPFKSVDSSSYDPTSMIEYLNSATKSLESQDNFKYMFQVSYGRKI